LSPEINGIPVSQVGSGLVNDAEQKKSHEVDVAAFGDDPNGRRVLLAIGEAKWAETVSPNGLCVLWQPASGAWAGAARGCRTRSGCCDRSRRSRESPAT
jgi:hypothetical protein